MSRRRLLQLTGLPPSTLHRSIHELRDYGVPIDTRTRNGEAWYSLDGHALPPLTLSATGLLALRFARAMLAPLDGTEVTQELDQLLSPHAARKASKPAKISLAPQAASSPAVVSNLERALSQRRRVRISAYTRSERQPKERLLDPLCLRYVQGTLYFVGFDHQRKAIRSFKVARIRRAEKLPDPCTEHPDFEEAAYFEHAVKAGAGTPIDLCIRFPKTVAHLVPEYPLIASQTLTAATDGSMLLRARVAGLEEAKRYILGWGKDATVLEPTELRDAVAEELATAARNYRRSEGPRQPKAARAQSSERSGSQDVQRA